MAKEIRINVTVNVKKGNVTDRFQPGTISIDQVTAGGPSPGYVVLTTAEADISFGSVVPGVIILQNVDPTNKIQFGPKNASNVMQLLGELLPGEVAIFRLAATGPPVLRMKALVASCGAQIKGYNA